MNNERRKEIDRLMERVNSLLSDLSEIKDSIENVRDEEQEYLDNLPENMADGERAEKAQFGERRDETLRRVRSIFPTLTNAAEEAHDYGRAYERLHAYCRLHDLY